jgi:hypothetical protein
MHDALDHIYRVCHQSNTMTKRLYWIMARCRSALDGGDDWRNFDYPRNRSMQKENLREKNRALMAALKEIGYGESDGEQNGGIMCRAIARAAIDDFGGEKPDEQT